MWNKLIRRDHLSHFMSWLWMHAYMGWNIKRVVNLFPEYGVQEKYDSHDYIVIYETHCSYPHQSNLCNCNYHYIVHKLWYKSHLMGNDNHHHKDRLENLLVQNTSIMINFVNRFDKTRLWHTNYDRRYENFKLQLH